MPTATPTAYAKAGETPTPIPVIPTATQTEVPPPSPTATETPHWDLPTVKEGEYAGRFDFAAPLDQWPQITIDDISSHRWADFVHCWAKPFPDTEKYFALRNNLYLQPENGRFNADNVPVRAETGTRLLVNGQEYRMISSIYYNPDVPDGYVVLSVVVPDQSNEESINLINGMEFAPPNATLTRDLISKYATYPGAG